MEKQKFAQYLQQIQVLTIPRWSELPQFDLYMDQVVSFINKMLEPLEFDELTPAMINNYVKAGLVRAPQKKRYSQQQLARLIVIAILKSVFSIGEIKQGLHLVVHPDKNSQTYDYFVTVFLKTIQDVVGDFANEVVITAAKQDDLVVETTNLVKLSCSAVVQRTVVLKLLGKLEAQQAEEATLKIEESQKK
ncbi:DUF1836 domain-containing protein [Lapidilactobacillus achengensis]|uniref:DUF1836 domain-containing protein n=1 Tax=Lapidilactobacillus achengensis TaxID=2486000 RepID=A0ABW1ULS0_9LACO|nr:DUF1836 domain-containing protein [Lapidilactobacillus achengensis]